MEFYTLDIETAATDKSMAEHAGLEPWRYRQGKAKITSISVHNPDGSVIQLLNDSSEEDFVEKTRSLLSSLENKVVYAHFAVFDIAWLIAMLQPNKIGAIPSEIRNINWRCSQLLAKWLCNGQVADSSRFSYSLANLVSTFLKDHPMTESFVAMKNRSVSAGDTSGYWEERGELDVIMTDALVKFLLTKVPAEMRTGLLTEFGCLVPVANSWLLGIRIDLAALDRLQPKLLKRKTELALAAGVDESVLSSPKRLATLLFETWGLPVHSRTPKGAPQCSREALKWVQYKAMNNGLNDIADRLGCILEAKTITTLLSKYVKTTYEALEHTGDGYIYGAPRIFGTYTGRFTYSNSTSSYDSVEDSRARWKTGIALHQIPRNAKEIRSILLPPEGLMIYEADASGQESRLMAIRSNDQQMLKVFSDGLNFHSMTGASLIGMDYYDFEEARELEGDSGYYTEQRQLGKLANLSCNYRIGGKSLSEKSFVNYDTFMTVDTGKYVVNTFCRTYPGVPNYWEDVVWESKEKGYVEVFGGRRYKLSKWKEERWGTESSAINVPIQGAGASMKEIAIFETYKKNPQALFSLDLHDANFFYVPIEGHKEICAEIDNTLNNINYTDYWGFKIPIPLPYESKFGTTFADVK